MKLLVLLSVVILCCQTGWATVNYGMCNDLPPEACLERKMMLQTLVELAAVAALLGEDGPQFKQKLEDFKHSCLDKIGVKGSYSCVCTGGVDVPEGKSPMKLKLTNIAASSAQAFTTCYKDIFYKNPSCNCTPSLPSDS